MNKKTAIVSVLLGVLLIGIVSAGLLDYFGKIEGSVTVEGPVFYATKNVLDESVNLRGLWVNELPDESSYTSISDGDFRAFATNSLEINSFYSARYDFTLHAKLNAPDEIPEPQRLRLELFVYNDDWEWEQDICSTTIEIEKTKKESYAYCEGNPISMNEDDIFYWKISGLHLNESASFRIELDGNTKIEVSAI